MYSTRRKIRVEAEAEQLLEQYAHYPGTFRDFCAEVEVDGRSLRAWQRRLTPELPPPDATVQFVELAAASALMAPSRPYRIRIGDVSIELSEDFSAQTLRRLLDVVRGC